ncbi:hypothetical protein ACE7GA_22205 [Roseomonas sp. CCTCC AB2023176]|uniref:hypothetical protein n=1 Tax=Roseomonas sp. CCTCC AB2023176 TaxID=3342640 RepID=UPI0035D9B34C
MRTTEANAATALKSTRSGLGWDLGAGDDLVARSLAEGHDASDYANGGAGVDTLRLEVARADWLSSALQADIARCAVFLASSQGIAGRTFAFSAFGLQAGGFERVEAWVDGLALARDDDPVTAVADRVALTEDTTASGNVLANDIVPDLVAAIAVVTGPTKGASVRDGTGPAPGPTIRVGLPVSPRGGLRDAGQPLPRDGRGRRHG